MARSAPLPALEGQIEQARRPDRGHLDRGRAGRRIRGAARLDSQPDARARAFRLPSALRRGQYHDERVAGARSDADFGHGGPSRRPIRCPRSRSRASERISSPPRPIWATGSASNATFRAVRSSRRSPRRNGTPPRSRTRSRRATTSTLASMWRGSTTPSPSSPCW